MLRVKQSPLSAIEHANVPRSLIIARNSHIEPDQHGRWIVDLSPVGGAILDPFLRRSKALVAEQERLRRTGVSQVMGAVLEKERFSGMRELDAINQPDRRPLFCRAVQRDIMRGKLESFASLI
jgi:hypothetical protein